MTLFTDNPFEKMMIQKPNGRRDNAPPVPYPPACAQALTTSETAACSLSPCLCFLPLQGTVPLCGVLCQKFVFENF